MGGRLYGLILTCLVGKRIPQYRLERPRALWMVPCGGWIRQEAMFLAVRIEDMEQPYPDVHPDNLLG